MRIWLLILLSLFAMLINAQETKPSNPFSLSVSGGYQFNSDSEIFSYLKQWDDFEYTSSDFFGGANITYSGQKFDLSAGFQSSYQDMNSDIKRTTLYTRILEVRTLWQLPFFNQLKAGGSVQKKIQELKVFSNPDDPFLGVYAYSAYYLSPTIAYNIPVNKTISIQITAQHAIPVNEDSWTNFQGDTLNTTKERQSTSRVFIELFYKL